MENTIFTSHNGDMTAMLRVLPMQPRENLSICKVYVVPVFVSSFQIISIGRVPEIKPATFRYQALYRLSQSCHGIRD